MIANWLLVIVISQGYGGDKVEIWPFHTKTSCTRAMNEIYSMAKGARISAEYRCVPGTDNAAKETP